MQHSVLGKGLSALIPERVDFLKENITPENVLYVNTEKIRDNALQPRAYYDQEKLAELQASIKEKGILQPILVRPVDDGYEVVAGERRLRAARGLNLKEVPVVVRNVNAEEALVLALIENVQREDLNPIEEAQAFKRLADEFHMSHEDIAKSVGKDRSTISNTLRLLNLPQEIQDSVFAGKISMGHARALLAVEDLSAQKKIFSDIIKKGMSVRELENLINVKIEGLARKKILKAKVRDHEMVLLEEELQRVLGTKVRIQAKKKRGKLIIEYYSLDDFDRILKILKRN